MKFPDDMVTVEMDENGALVAADGAPVSLDDVMGLAVANANSHLDAGGDLVVSWTTFKRFFAGECVGLSPYDVPHGLEAALSAVFAKAKPWFHAGDKFAQQFGIRTATRRELREAIDDWTENTPEVAVWNERRNGRDGMGIATAFSVPPDPDDDFVDLGALSRNTLVGIIKDCEAFDKLSADFDARHGKDGDE